MKMDYVKAVDVIANTLERLGVPLTEAQRIGVSGSVAVLLEQAYQQGLREGFAAR